MAERGDIKTEELLAKADKTTTVNSQPLSANVVLTKTDVGLSNVPNLDMSSTANITDSLNKRFVTDAQSTVIGSTSGTNTGDNATNTQYSGLAASKQDTLISGTNIKTVNGTALPGAGDIATGTVTEVTSATAELTVATGTTTPAITIVSAPKLTTARNINGVAFDGTANITVADSTKEPTANKDATGGYVGLTLFKINFKNALNTITSFFTNANTIARTYTFADRDGTIADDTDITGAKARANHTGTQLASTVSDFNAAALVAAPAETTTTIGTLINGATAKTSLVDADQVGIWDSVTGLLKKWSWVNVKANLEAYFDTIYLNNAETAAKATSLAGGLGGQIPYQSAADTTAFLANGTAGQILQSNGTTLAPSWGSPGAGDMVLASAQTVTGAKTFDDTKLLLRNVADTFNGSFVNTNTADRIYTLKDAAGTLAFTSDITGTNSGTNTGDQTITLTGDVTGTGTGSFAATIANAAVTLAKMANMATGSLFYRKTVGSGVPEVQTLATLKTDLGLTGTNSGDQTSIVGITGTTAEFNAANTDGDFATGGGTASGTNTGDNATNTQYSGLAASKQDVSGKDATGGYAGLTLFKINFKNAANTFTSFFTNAATAARTYTFPDKDITVAGLVDITGTNSGTNTGDQTSIVGITGTTAQFNTANTDGDFATGGGTATGTNTGDNATNSQYSGLVSNATHTGDVTGATALTIAANAVTNAKAAQMATKTYKGRTSAATGNAEDVAVATLKTDLGLVKGDVGLGNVDNTSNATERAATATLTNKTISSADNTLKPLEQIIIAVSDESTALTVGTAKATFRLGYAFTITGVRASVNTAPTGSTIIVDINEAGTSIMTTNKLSIDVSELTSTTAAVAAGLTDTAIADDGALSIDVDQVGSTIAGKGLRVVIIGYRT